MERLEEIAERIHQAFETRTAARDGALAHARTLTRHCANAIRAIHRNEFDLAKDHLIEAGALVKLLRSNLANFPDLYFAGYTQDALKEYAEANLVGAMVKNQALPTPEELGLEQATYMQGLAEAASELRRRCLDELLHGNSAEAERLLGHMDDVYSVLVTMDYPDAITGGLRRLTDLVRSVVERTRGDLALSLRQEQLQKNLQRLEDRLERYED
ncbi:MAG: haloacid dehalogenase [Chloroflexota bacterium]|nr:MAG: haloacid dehalogenase [Chloroflexota bacterium]